MSAPSAWLGFSHLGVRLKIKSHQLPDGCIALDGGDPLFADGSEALSATTFEREIGLTGEYKTRKFTLARKQFEEVIANHKASGVDPAVDRGHETWFGADPGTEARGWVRALSIRPSALAPNRDALVASIELNDLGKHAVANKHFRYLSMGINLKAVDLQTGQPIGAVLDHLALVKRPFIEGMQPLSLSSSTGDEPEEIRMESLFKALGVKADADEAEALSALTEKLSAKDAEINALKAQCEADAASSLSLAEKVKAMEVEQLTKALDAKIDQFAVDPSERPALLELAAASPETFSKLLALRTPRNPGGVKLETPKNADVSREALQEAAIEAYIAAHAGSDYTAAMIACASANPELFADAEVA